MGRGSPVPPAAEEACPPREPGAIQIPTEELPRGPGADGARLAAVEAELVRLGTVGAELQRLETDLARLADMVEGLVARLGSTS